MSPLSSSVPFLHLPLIPFPHPGPGGPDLETRFVDIPGGFVCVGDTLLVGQTHFGWGAIGVWEDGSPLGTGSGVVNQIYHSTSQTQ